MADFESSWDPTEAQVDHNSDNTLVTARDFLLYVQNQDKHEKCYPAAAH